MLNIPNLFLFYRLLAVPVFIVFYLLDWQAAAFVVFATAAVSDFFDGYFARKLGLVNDF
ncbi:MAG: CDP-alcohol phosphatidyltransferase family protein, partial [Candidatus Nomurabacteria bacterium]|nr:CDP-alcohol phosphatidyltransferase family protein [Candidatus Nomurabacteria bacterium]